MRILVPVLIYLVLPLVGFGIYLRLLVLIRREKSIIPPAPEFFIIFGIYGGGLQVILTALFWEWSGMASIGAVFLLFIAPIFMAIISIMNWRKSGFSKYHKYILFSSLAYLPISPILLLAMQVIK